MASFKKMLLCYDSTPEGRRALRQGADLAEKLGAETHLLAIASPATGVVADGMTGAAILPMPESNKIIESLLDEGVERLRARGLVATGHLVFGPPSSEIPAAARALGVDLVVVGHKTRGTLARWWAGPSETRLLDLVPCSVLVSIDPTDT